MKSTPRYSVWKTKDRDKCRIKFLNWRNEWEWRTGFTDKSESKRLGQQLAMEADEIRRGIRPAPTLADDAILKPIQDHVEAYLSWGRVQGGRKNRPWAVEHAEKVENHLEWWIDGCGFKSLADITLMPVEKRLHDLKAQGYSGKTLMHYSSAILSFVRWCILRRILKSDPLTGLGCFDDSVKDPRRALTGDEIQALLQASPVDRRILYEFALLTGFRAREISTLMAGDFNTEDCTVMLRAENAKDREEKVVPIQNELMERIVQLCKDRQPEFRPLEFNLKNAARMMDLDLGAAKIPKRTFSGKIDFHALRTTYVNLVIATRCDPKTMMELTRHKDANLTMNTYGRVDKSIQRELVERIGRQLHLGGEKKGAILEPSDNPRKAVGAELFQPQRFMSSDMVETERSRTSRPICLLRQGLHAQ